MVRESGERSGKGVDEKSMAWGCDVLLVVESWKKWSGREWWRPGRELDDRRMAWNVRCCFG